VKSKFSYLLAFILTILLSKPGIGQTCTTLGQNPTTAFPVCGTSVFEQKNVPVCGGKSVPTPPCNDQITYKDVNPFWYKFTCFNSGTLGFMIDPISSKDDYDWELFDITGVDPMDVYTNNSLIISANWSGTQAPTGAGPTGSNWYECATSNFHPNPNPISIMPNLIAGHNYILLISNFSSSQIGYKLSFQGGSASIIDPVIPALTKAHAVCDGTQILLFLNKKMNCSSLSSDGSDFSITGASQNLISKAIGRGCAVSFDTDTLELTMQNILTPGSYTVSSKVGSDNNTLIDNCGNQLVVGLSESLVFTAAVPTAMDSIAPLVCVQDTLKLVFGRPMDCNSIASDGSDFFITGPSNVTIKTAFGNCNSGLSDIINVVLNNPIKTNGNYQLHLKNGSDGNSILNECGKETAAGSIVNFSVQNVTTADFNAQLNVSCKFDTLLLSHNGNNGTNQWNWKLDNGFNSTLQNPIFKFNQFGKLHVTLLVRNDFCSDSSSVDIDLQDHTVKAGFALPDTLCLKDSLIIIDNSSNNSVSWKWNFGNGVTSSLKQPIGIYFQANGQQNQYLVMQVVQNAFNCSDTSIKKVYVLPNCYIDIPSGFTPNGDGLNDYLYPLNAFKAQNLNFKVYNRYGQVIYESTDWQKKWDGRVKGELQPSGTYVWTLDYTHKDTGQTFHLKGTTVLIR
jgi:gliding motility-associated-like protein